LSFETSLPLLTNLAFLLGLSLFFGLAFEEFYAHQGRTQPGGVRTFPLLALAGAMLYLLDATHLIPISVGVLVVGAWLHAYYRSAVAERDAEGVQNVGLTVPVCNLLAYLLGPIALTQPHWVAVALTVTAVLLLTGRERLHTMARQLELPEIITAGKFLILTGIILPLLPNEPITPLTRVTPYQAWLALVAVCTLSYGSYLLQRYWASNRSAFVTAILGGLYSSTATTVVLARRASTREIPLARAQVGIALATAVMYLRILAIIAVFNWSLGAKLAPSLLALSLLGFALAGLHNWCAGRPAAQTSVRVEPSNPLELSAAALFAVLFVAISIASTWAADHFGAADDAPSAHFADHYRTRCLARRRYFGVNGDADRTPRGHARARLGTFWQICPLRDLPRKSERYPPPATPSMEHVTDDRPHRGHFAPMRCWRRTARTRRAGR